MFRIVVLVFGLICCVAAVIVVGGFSPFGQDSSSPAIIVSPTPADEFTATLEANRKKWKDANILNYEIELKIESLSPVPPATPVIITVRDGQRVSVRAKDPKDRRTTVYFEKSVDELFDQVIKAKKEARALDVTYDATLGFPNHLGVLILATDASYTIEVVSLTVLND